MKDPLGCLRTKRFFDARHKRRTVLAGYMLTVLTDDVLHTSSITYLYRYANFRSVIYNSTLYTE